MKFPKIVRHRKAEATIYGRSKAYPMYRVAWRAGGKRMMKSCPTYSDALAWAEKKARELASGSELASLTAAHARDALAAINLLESYRVATGHEVSLQKAIADYVEANRTLNGRSLPEAAKGFMATVASVKRVDIAEALDQFLESRKARTIAREGKRPQLSAEQHYNSGRRLLEFAGTFHGHAVCDLTREHLGIYFAKHASEAPKTRNERRGLIKMFLAWAVEKDFLSGTHRLFEASELKHETADPETIELYSAPELRTLLEHASGELLPVLALAGLAGMRLKEIIRLTWEDVFHVPEHIEVKAHKSKTRSRRLIQFCPALAAWLEPYRGRTGLVWSVSYDKFHEDFDDLRESFKKPIPNRRNGLRHAYVSAHYALYSDEGLTSAQAGNSPQMVHKNYKGLLTKREGEAWFAVAPAHAPNIERTKLLSSSFSLSQIDRNLLFNAPRFNPAGPRGEARRDCRGAHLPSSSRLRDTKSSSPPAAA